MTKREELKKRYVRHLKNWVAESLNHECYHKNFNGCKGHYSIIMSDNTLECDVCHTQLLNFTFKEW